MVVAVPAFPESDEADIGDVVALHRDAIDRPALMAAAMGEMADEPMTGQRDADPDRDAPDEPGQAANGEEQDGPGQLLQHPGSFEKAIEGVIVGRGLDDETWRMVELHCAMHLPPGIDEEGAAVRIEIMALLLALGPVADVVRGDHAEGACHADQCAEIDQKTLEPERRFKAAMDEKAMHADRMAGAECHGACRDEEGEGVPGEGEGAEDEGGHGEGAGPQ